MHHRRSNTINPQQILSTIVRTGMCRTNAAQRPAPSIFIYPGLTAKPIWKIEDVMNSTTLSRFQESIHHMEQEYEAISQKIESDYIIKQDEHTLHQGQWAWHSFISKGKIQHPFQLLCPITSSLLQSLPNLLTGVPFAYSFFSNLKPNTHINPHYGPCNIRLRIHYPLKVPKLIADTIASSSSSLPSSSNTINDTTAKLGMKIADQIVPWQRNVPIVFDDTYEHSVWNNTTEDRVVLLFDVWHPELSDKEKEGILNMFEEARSKGWIS